MRDACQVTGKKNTITEQKSASPENQPSSMFDKKE
jgi:ribosomal protein L28